MHAYLSVLLQLVGHFTLHLSNGLFDINKKKLTLS